MRVQLEGGAYEARSIIANAQRCINLFPEIDPTDSPTKLTHYPTPGLNSLAATSGIVWRCLYTASNGQLYGVLDQSVYAISSAWVLTLLGTLSGVLTTPVSMADNGLTILIVDGSINGYAINMTDNAFAQIIPTNFYGADVVKYLDTYFILNVPGTNEFYISLSEISYDILIGGNGFDPLDIAAKTGNPDNIVGIAVFHREIWLIGALTTEVWFNSGAADFTFQALPGAYIEHGCVAKYSIATQDLSCYWLTQDKQGQNIVVRGSEYVAKRISTHAIEEAISSYSVVSDAIGMIYQQEGHTFYILTFPTANATWVYDQATELWHERLWLDSNGKFNRHRANCLFPAYGKIVVGDWQNGVLYNFDLNTYTDNGNPIARVRSFPHLLDDGKRVLYHQFIADMDVGEILDNSNPTVSMRYSDTKGATWGNRMEQTLGAMGQYNKQPSFRRLGLARDRVFELSWSMNGKTALNGAFVETQTAGT